MSLITFTITLVHVPRSNPFCKQFKSAHAQKNTDAAINTTLRALILPRALSNPNIVAGSNAVLLLSLL